ncbi:hydroxyethylthiazole kinase [Streptomyces spiroverticillatus]|uniref:Hydroxyethylthiazole kinase n=1 Tax=Streptomyces finlayi TaxID=67296 RepID=A0A919CFL6_9ACTN|nr:hydroxyethylthiazole kinase [Streptomyces finlayi]GHA47378.1 hydroxyethylthiazole kinase [Streptomyces spiroverticillatus]GHD18538.1 hydroxyethylthiazole kinase [Streptomyces finlayi]
MGAAFVSARQGAGVSPGAVAEVFAGLRGAVPLVHCLTNVVVSQFTANMLLAAGAAPAMVHSAEEAGALARVAGGVLVNLGTVTSLTAEAMRVAVKAAAGAGRPWVLDPVGVGPLPWRTGLAHELLESAPPAVVRGNPSEILALDGGSGGRGVDSTDAPEAALAAATALARRYGCVVAVSGPVDVLTDGERVVRLANGHPLLPLVTGTGCALGALVAACAAVTDDALLAAAAATSVLNVAAEDAADGCAGPGSFAVALIDGLYALGPDRLAEAVNVR